VTATKTTWRRAVGGDRLLPSRSKDGLLPVRRTEDDERLPVGHALLDAGRDPVTDLDGVGRGINPRRTP